MQTYTYIWIWLHCYPGVCVRKLPIPGCKPWFLKRHFWKKQEDFPCLIEGFENGKMMQFCQETWQKKRLSIHLNLKSSPFKISALHNELKWRNEIIQNRMCICRRNYLAKILTTYPFFYPYMPDRAGTGWVKDCKWNWNFILFYVHLVLVPSMLA